MALRSKNKVRAEFSMASMTDVIFLLLIFFMLTSNFVKPLVIPVNLPSSKNGDIELSEVFVSINERNEYFVNEDKIAIDNLEKVLRAKLKSDKGLIVLSIDKSVPIEHFVKVTDIAITLKAKVKLATQSM